MKVVAIVQARMGSTRLPSKVMKEIGGVPMIELLLARLSRAKEVDQIVVATSVDEKNGFLATHVEELGYLCVRGSENDVLQRYLDAAYASKADIVVRVTGDCPLIDPTLVDEVVARFKREQVDYLANNLPPTYSRGSSTFRPSPTLRCEYRSASRTPRRTIAPWLP